MAELIFLCFRPLVFTFDSFLAFIYLAVLGLSCSFLVVARGLSCPVAHGIPAPRPGMEAPSPTAEGGLSTAGPLGKSPLDNLE